MLLRCLYVIVILILIIIAVGETQFPELEKIESEYHEIVLERLNFVVQRRQQDDLDDLCLFADVPQGQYSFRHYH